MEQRYRGDRDGDRDRSRSRDRDRYGDTNDFHHQPRRPSLFSDGPPPDSGNFRAKFQPVSGGPPPGPGFRPMGGGLGTGGGFGNDFHHPPPTTLSGQKRGFPFSGRSSSPESYDGTGNVPSKSFVKLFVGSVPRTATEDEIRPLFEGQGKVMEVALIRDKRTGEQQGCCFVKYATSEEAETAIRALHNQYTLPGGVGPIQVRYADGERERLGNGAVEYKLFVGSLNKFATEKEVEPIFAPYGRVEDVYLMRDERKQSRGCGFVKFFNKDSALAAISALNGIYTMRGCDQPLIVRFADPKRPRPGEQRTGPTFGGPGFGSFPPAGIRPVTGSNFPGSAGGRGPPNAWQSMNPQNLVPSSNPGVHGFVNQFPSRSGDAAASTIPVGHLGPQGSVAEGSGSVAVSASSASPQNFNQSRPQPQSSGQQILPLQKPQQFPASMQQQHQGPGSYSQAQTSEASISPINQLQTSSQGQAPYNQAFPSQRVPGFTGQLPSGQYQVQQNAMGQQNKATVNPQARTTLSMENTHLPSLSPKQPLGFQQSHSHLAQMMSQQTQSLQASFQSSQQAISQLQQQVQLMQPSNQHESSQQHYQASKQQSQWAGVTQTTATSTPGIAPKTDAPSTSSAAVGRVGTGTPAPVMCNWTEHISPDGYKYYHNSATGESTWIKPEELTSYEQQQQKLSVQQPPNQPSPQALPTQRGTYSQPQQLQSQFQQTGQFQHPPLSSVYQAPRSVANQNAQYQAPRSVANQNAQYQAPRSVANQNAQYQAPRSVANQNAQEAAYTQLQTPANSGMDVRFQQGFQASHDRAWKGNSNSGGA